VTSSRQQEPGVPHEHVVVSVGPDEDVTEELCVEVVEPDAYRLLVPPLLTLGLAPGDEFRIDEATGRPEVTRRSGLLVVWVYPRETEPEDVASLADAVIALGGTFEGGPEHGRMVVFTAPIGVGFPTLEHVFDEFVREHDGAEWLYGNVYADDGVTPLGWWQ
jgi:hypothetical protein